MALNHKRASGGEGAQTVLYIRNTLDSPNVDDARLSFLCWIPRTTVLTTARNERSTMAESTSETPILDLLATFTSVVGHLNHAHRLPLCREFVSWRPQLEQSVERR